MTEVLDLIYRPDILVQLHVDHFGDFCAAASTLTGIALLLTRVFVLDLSVLRRSRFLRVFDGRLLLTLLIILVAVLFLGDVVLLLEWEAVRHVGSVHEHWVLRILLAFRSVRAATVLSHLPRTLR